MDSSIALVDRPTVDKLRESKYGMDEDVETVTKVFDDKSPKYIYNGLYDVSKGAT